MNLDIAFVRALLTDKEAPGLVQQSGFMPEMLFDDGKKAYDYALDFFKQHGQFPQLETVEQHAKVDLGPLLLEPTSFYVTGILHRWKVNAVGAGLKVAAKMLEKGEADESLVSLMETMSQVRSVGQLEGNGLVDLTEKRSIDGRIESYREMKTLGGRIDGIPTPWPLINEGTRGVHKDELWVMIGKLKTGKTWGLIAMALHAWAAGYKVLLVSEEMGLDKIARRWDAVHAKLPYGDFVAGKLDTRVEEMWIEKMEAIESSDSPFWIAGKERVKNVMDVELLIEELRPDIIFIDGAYFLQSEGKGGGASKWDRTSQVIDEIQALVQRKHVPTVVSWQFNRKVGKNKTEAGAGDVAFSYEVMQNADVVIGMFRNEDLETKKQMKLEVIEARESAQIPPLLCRWDLDEMDFSEIGPQIGEEVVTDPTDDAGIDY